MGTGVPEPSQRETRQSSLPAGDAVEAVRRSVAEVLGLPLAAVSNDSLLIDLGADSFQFIDVVCRIESQFRITLPASYSAPSRISVDALARTVVSRLAVECRHKDAETFSGASRILWSE